MSIRPGLSLRRVLAPLAAALMLFQTALAGPPLLCRPFEIAGAKSLPWEGQDWTSAPRGYDVNRVDDDTLGLLKADTPIIVRMETIRRATVLARGNSALTDALLARLRARVTDAEAKGERNALALFDAGYLVETYRQAYWITGVTKEAYWKFDVREPGRELDGYGLVLRAIELRSGDPEMELAAALITMDGKQEPRSKDHLLRAQAGAQPGSLLARNLALHFGLGPAQSAESQKLRRD